MRVIISLLGLPLVSGGVGLGGIKQLPFGVKPTCTGRILIALKLQKSPPSGDGALSLREGSS